MDIIPWNAATSIHSPDFKVPEAIKNNQITQFRIANEKPFSLACTTPRRHTGADDAHEPKRAKIKLTQLSTINRQTTSRPKR